MGRSKVGKLPGFCLNRLSTRVLVRSPQLDSKSKVPVLAVAETEELNPKPARNSSDVKANDAFKLGDDGCVQSRVEADGKGDGAAGAADKVLPESPKKLVESGRVVVVVVDSTKASRGALLWALSHAIQSKDTVVLLAVIAASAKQGVGDSRRKEADLKRHPVLCSSMNLCQAKIPGVQIQLSLVERRDKGPAIVEEAERLGASLLVLGQKRRWVTWRLLLMWAGSRRNRGGGGGGGVVDYCIQNAACMTVAVRRRSRKAGGGYLLTTRRHKDFWLLA